MGPLWYLGHHSLSFLVQAVPALTHNQVFPTNTAQGIKMLPISRYTNLKKSLFLDDAFANHLLPHQEGKEYGLSAVVEDYRTRFILPCRQNANSLIAAALKIQVGKRWLACS